MHSDMAYNKSSLACDKPTRDRLNKAVIKKTLKRGKRVSMDEHLNELQDLEDSKGRGPKVRGSID